MSNVIEALESLIRFANAETVKYNEENGLVWINNTWEYTVGKRYLKITLNSGSAVAFVDKDTGNIYKAASWSAPAKGVRGNVLSDENGMEAFIWYSSFFAVRSARKVFIV